MFMIFGQSDVMPAVILTLQPWAAVQ